MRKLVLLWLFFMPFVLSAQMVLFPDENTTNWDVKCLVFSDMERTPDIDENGRNWYETTYDDSSWSTMSLPFEDYKDGTEPTYYLRTSFVLDEILDANPGFFCKHDDGIEVYINGYHVISDESHTSYDFWSYEVPVDYLVQGENVLAIRLDNRGGSNIYLDYKLLSNYNDYLYVTENGIRYRLNNFSSYYVNGYTDELPEDVVIPETVNGLPVIAFDLNCFARSNIKTVYVPKSINNVFDWVFLDCKELTSVTLAEGVEYISLAFANCSKLKTINIPSTVIQINPDAFSGCNLETVYLDAFINGISSVFGPDVNIIYGENAGALQLYSDNELLNTIDEYINKRYLTDNDGKVTIPVYMEARNVDICQMQFEIYCDPPFKIARDEDNELMIDLDKTRFNYSVKKGYSHSVTVTEELHPDWLNRYSIVISSSSNAAISGEDGLLFNITFDYDGDLEDRGYRILSIENVELASPSAQAYHPGGVEKYVQVNRRDPGDADGDGDVTVSDYANVVNAIAHISDLDDAARKASDVNGDGNVTVTDLAGIVNIILYGNWQGEQAAGAKARDNSWATYDNNTTVSIEPFSIAPGETKEVEVNLSSMYNDLSQAQFDLVLPKGLSVVGLDGEPDIMPGELVASGKRGFSHTIASAQREDGTVRVLCLSDSNTPFTSSNGSIVRITVQADENLSGENCDLALSNIKLSRTDASKVNVAGVKANVKVKDSTTDIKSIGINGTQHVDIYSIDGVRTGKLNRGINIIRTADGNTRKILVK